MKLRRVDILGFKSFRDRTRVELSDGMTAIVGPNGCGKSNVVDAIKWAMGDMSPKSLRGQSMSDVIFAGSEQRKPMGMAEVTLTFENEGDLEALDDDEIDWGDSVPKELRNMSEISVTRRLHRSGDSEYLINKAPCRLMDIQNLLAGTGVGKQGYSIIEQNRVGFIVGAKPSERRLLIEEASGITRYKSQRDRAERKLVRTEENLQRVDDVLREVQKQIRSLERQARKAAQYRALVDELRSLEIALLVARRDELDSERTLLVEQCEVADEAIEHAKKAIAVDSETLDRAKVEAFQAEKAHSEATEAFYRLDTKLNLARSKAEHATVNLQEANRRLGSSEREALAQADRIEELKEELAQLEGDFEGLADLTELESTLEEAQQQLEEARQAAEDARRQREKARQSLETARSGLARCEDRVEFFDRRENELELRENALQTSVEEATEELEELESRVTALGGEVEALRERLEGSRKREEEFHDARTTALERKRATEKELREARNRRADLETRTDALRTMIARGEGFSDALKSVLELGADRDDVHGTLADHLVVDEGREGTLANALEGMLLDVIVDDLEVAHELLDDLGELEGRVSFRTLDGDTASDVAAAAARTLDDSSVVSRVDDDGRVEFTNGRLVAGTTSSQSILEQRRRLGELEAEFEAASDRVETLEATAEEAEKALREANQKSELAKRETETLSLEFRSKEQDLGHAERELEKVRRVAESARAEIIPVLRARDELASEREENAARIDQLREAKSTAAEKLEAMGDSDDGLQEELERLRGEVTDAKVSYASAKERRRNLVSARERTERSLESSKSLLDRYEKESTQLADRIVELEKTIEESEKELEGAEGERNEAKQAADAAREKLDTANAEVRKIELALRDRRSKLEKKTEERQKLEFRQREVSLGVAHVDEQLRDRFDVSEDQARRLVEEIETPPAERKGKRDYLKSRIESLGPVNAMAEDEYEAARERNEFLTDQKEDLEAAIADLRQAISRMDRESRRRFKETYDAVNAKFKEIFPSLFRGGRAELILTDPDDLLSTGVDIQVQPPGKRLQNVSLLSGGEKALTAVSLIFSIFILKPTPFSILDEVDAPLDEANVGRFAGLVRNLSETSQMIVITHSRRTMESADVLYGVTMEEAGVSKMVNVRLSDVDDRLAS